MDSSLEIDTFDTPSQKIASNALSETIDSSEPPPAEPRMSNNMNISTDTAMCPNSMPLGSFQTAEVHAAEVSTTLPLLPCQPSNPLRAQLIVTSILKQLAHWHLGIHREPLQPINGAPARFNQVRMQTPLTYCSSDHALALTDEKNSPIFTAAAGLVQTRYDELGHPKACQCGQLFRTSTGQHPIRLPPSR